MAPDQRALDAYQRGDTTALWGRLNEIWMVIILETLEEIERRGRIPGDNMQARRTDMLRAGIFVDRMSVAVAAVLAKKAGKGSAQFEQDAGLWMQSLPEQQKREVRTYLGAVGNPSPVPAPQDGLPINYIPDTMAVEFTAGFIRGLKASLSQIDAVAIENTIMGDMTGFQIGYARGSITGLGAGLIALLKSLKDIFQLAVSLTPSALATALGREAFLLLTSAAQRELRKVQIEEARRLTTIVIDTITDMAARPAEYVAASGSIGEIVGGEAGTWFAGEVKGKSAPDLGIFIGEIVGRIAFEILIQVILAAATEGVGNATRAGIAIGEGAQGASKFASLAQKLRMAVSRLRGIQRLLILLLEDERGAVLLSALDAELEMALGEGAVLQRGGSGGFPLLQRLPALSADAQAAAGRLLGQEFSPDLVAAWNACSNTQAVAELAEVQRLLGTGSAADREAAYQLSERLYGNWRNRFWTRVRGDPNLSKIFTDAGARFEGSSGAPFYRIGANRNRNLTVTLDHFVVRRVDNPARAVDALNVRPSIAFENSATLEAIRRDNFVKGWAP